MESQVLVLTLAPVQMSEGARKIEIDYLRDFYEQVHAKHVEAVLERLPAPNALMVTEDGERVVFIQRNRGDLVEVFIFTVEEYAAGGDFTLDVEFSQMGEPALLSVYAGGQQNRERGG
jgi:hypothetical protein